METLPKVPSVPLYLIHAQSGGNTWRRSVWIYAVRLFLGAEEIACRREQID